MIMKDEMMQINVFDADDSTAMYPYKLKLERVMDGFSKLGLTTNQSKVFVYLGKYGQKTAPEVCKALQIPRTETYTVLTVLQNRGIVTTDFSHPVKFSALPIDKAILTLVNSERERINLLAEEEVSIVSLWNEVPSYVIETDETMPDKLQMLQGSPCIHGKIKDMIVEAKGEILLYCTEKDLARLYHSDFIDELGNTMADTRIIISQAKQIPNFVEKIDRDKIRIMPQSTDENQCFIIKDSIETLTFLRNANHPSHRTCALWSNSKSITNSMKTLFEYYWDSAQVSY